jgi:phage repressor protein C with HTH and peptisase S24 domain
MVNHLSANLEFLLAARGMSQQELARASRISLNTINRWCNGRSSRPSPAKLGAAASVLGVTFRELVHEDLTDRAGGMAAHVTEEQPDVFPVDVGRRVPLVSDVPAGDPMEIFDDHPVGHGWDMVVCPAELTDPNAFALRLSGDSLEPRFNDGDIAIVSPNHPWREGSLVVAKISGDSVTCKYVRTRDNTVTLSPGNPQYSPRILDRSEVRWVYPVVYVIVRLVK